MSENPNDPKIIVDDDWKEQVQREKEQLQQESTEPPKPESEMPPASFAMLVSSLSTQALVALGYLPDPGTGQPMVNRDLAKHLIDTLGILEEKTQGKSGRSGIGLSHRNGSPTKNGLCLIRPPNR